MRVRGAAPDRLVWEMGLRPGRPPLWVFVGRGEVAGQAAA